MYIEMVKLVYNQFLYQMHLRFLREQFFFNFIYIINIQFGCILFLKPDLFLFILD